MPTGTQLFFGLLNLGEGTLAVNYLIFCALASLGALQFVAARSRLLGLMLLPAPLSKWLGVALVVGAYGWFFSVQPDLFIPGLAGGELFALFAIGFVLALVLAFALGFIHHRLLARNVRLPARREKFRLTDGKRAQLWLPRNSNTPPLVIVMRAAVNDALDVLSGELAASGAAVLMCEATSVNAALAYAREHAARFHPARRYGIGVGYGANQLLRAARESANFRAVMALAPFGETADARAGLRWLREIDYVSALLATWRRRRIQFAPAPSHARVVFGDEDGLMPPSRARQLYPEALIVAGARHFTLPLAPATLRLIAETFELSLPSARAAARVVTRPSLRGEAQE